MQCAAEMYLLEVTSNGVREDCDHDEAWDMVSEFIFRKGMRAED